LQTYGDGHAYVELPSRGGTYSERECKTLQEAAYIPETPVDRLPLTLTQIPSPVTTQTRPRLHGPAQTYTSHSGHTLKYEGGDEVLGARGHIQPTLPRPNTLNLTDDLEPSSESNRASALITGIETGWQDPFASLYNSQPRRNTHDSHVTVDSNELGLADGEPISPFSWYCGFVVNSDWSPESVHQSNTECCVSQAGIQNAFSVPAGVSELPNGQVDEPHSNDFLVLQWSQNASTLFGPALSQKSDSAFDQPQPSSGVPLMNEMGSFFQADQTASKICQYPAIADIESLQVSSQPGFIVDDFPGSMIAGEMFTPDPPTEQQSPASQEQALSEGGLNFADMLLHTTLIHPSYGDISDPPTFTDINRTPVIAINTFDQQDATTRACARYQGSMPSSDYSPKRRQPFQDMWKRQETGITRKVGACVRCRTQKIRVRPPFLSSTSFD
jgi:hypothetical protein